MTARKAKKVWKPGDPFPLPEAHIEAQKHLADKAAADREVQLRALDANDPRHRYVAQAHDEERARRGLPPLGDEAA